MKLLVAYRATLDYPAQYGMTPLMAAARAGCLEAVMQLTELGASAAAVSERGRTPSTWAKEMGHEVIAQYLDFHHCKVAEGQGLHAPVQNGFGLRVGFVPLCERGGFQLPRRCFPLLLSFPHALLQCTTTVRSSSAQCSPRSPKWSATAGAVQQIEVFICGWACPILWMTLKCLSDVIEFMGH